MSDVIHIEEARQRLLAAAPNNPIVEALDVLALALIEHGHQWTLQEHSLYENAIAYFSHKGSGSSA